MVDVRIKPLKWVDNCAETPFGTYTVSDHGYDIEEEWQWTFHRYPYGEPEETKHATEAAAKAAAQADYESLIRSTLSDAVAEREAEPVAVVVGHHVVQGPNVEFLTDNLDVGTKLYVTPPTSELEAHPDDTAVDRFTVAMKEKLAKKRGEGRGGWDDPNECSIEHLSYLLIQHVWKGDPLDVGNLAMMVHQRGGRIVIDDEARGVMLSPASELEALRKRVAELEGELEKSEDLFEAISHHIDEHSFSLAKGFCSQGAFTARRVREGGKADG